VLVQTKNDNERYEWQKASHGIIPVNAVETERHKYVDRAYYSGSLIPGKIETGDGCGYVLYGGKEIARNEYEVLCLAVLPLPKE
jgi:hypothetical protein